MKSDSEQQREFQRRLELIAQRSKTQTVFVGEDEAYQVPRGERKLRRSRFGILGNLWTPVSMLLALVIGAAGHAVGMLIRFNLHGINGWAERPDLDMLAQLFIGFGIAMLAGALIGLRSGSHTVLTLAGSALGVLFFHNAVHLYPDLFTRITSPLWVGQVLARTRPHSLLWMGISFPF